MADKIVKNSDLEHVQEKLVNEIETMLLSNPLVHALTGKGIQRFVSEITHAFGKSVHQGVSLHTDDNGVVADISVVLTDNVAVYASACALQDKINKLIRIHLGDVPCFVNVIVTGISE